MKDGAMSESTVTAEAIVEELPAAALTKSNA
jgi:hypothetical protein